MDNNINISLFDNYFSQRKNQNNQFINNDETNNTRNVVLELNNNTLNEVNVSHKISQIPYYSLYFLILTDYERLNVTQIEANNIQQITYNKSINNKLENNFYLFKYNDKNYIPLMEHIYSITNIKKLINTCIKTFSYLLNSLSILNNNKICFFNISPNNIVYVNNNGENPLINNFRLSILIKNLNTDYIYNILNELNDFTYQPLEIHILYCLFKNNMETISHSFIDVFCEPFMSNLHILNLGLFSEKYKLSYKQHCINIIKKYVNKPKKVIINDIIKNYDKWDIYGISVIYIQLFYCIANTFSLKHTFINELIAKLSLNLHPDPNCRMTLERTKEVVNELFNQHNNWNFVNNLNNSTTKLEELFNSFSS